MYYSEGYRHIIWLWDDEGYCYPRKVENVFLPEWDGFDKTVRPVVDSSAGRIDRRVWDFDSYFHNKLDTLLLDVVY